MDLRLESQTRLKLFASKTDSKTIEYDVNSSLGKVSAIVGKILP
mgnify:CR=1 FL=1